MVYLFSMVGLDIRCISCGSDAVEQRGERLYCRSCHLEFLKEETMESLLQKALERPIGDFENFVVATTFDIPGHKVERVLGPVFGMTVRTRGLGGKIEAGIMGLVGGEIKSYTGLAQEIRRQAVSRMVEEAKRLGANAVLGMRFDSTEIGEGNTEVFCYGTAVVISKV